MKLSKLTKTLLTTFLSFYLAICPIKSQEQKLKQVKINSKKYSLLEDKVTNEHEIIIRDKETLSKVLKTLQIQEEIDSLQLNPAALKLLELYAEGQEKTMEYDEHIAWFLNLPVRILADIVIGKPPTLEEIKKEFKDFTAEKAKETAGDIAKNPERRLKHLAYALFSQANEKAKYNLTILREKPEMDYETTIKFENNTYFINIFMKPSQQLYFDVVNIRKLEDTWSISFIKEVESVLPENLKEITDFVFKKYEETIQKNLEKLDPYKKLQDEIVKRKEECEKSRTKREKDLETKVNGLISKIKLDENIIVYVSNLTGNLDEDIFEIYSMTKDGKNKIQLTNNGFRSLHPRWTPDRKIIFCINTPKQKNTDIYIMDKDGSNLKQLTNTPEHEDRPIILSDGRLIFISNKKGNDDVYIKEKDGTIKQLTNTELDEKDLDISPDEKYICYIRMGWGEKEQGVFVLNLENTLERKLDKYGFNSRFSPDGKIGYSSGALWIRIKDINNNLQPSEFPDEEKCKSKGYPEYLKDLPYIPKEQDKKAHIMYFLGWLDKDTIIYRFDLAKLPEEPEDTEPTIKNIYTYNLKTKEIKKLTHTDNKVWNDHADCLKK